MGGVGRGIDGNVVDHGAYSSGYAVSGGAVGLFVPQSACGGGRELRSRTGGLTVEVKQVRQGAETADSFVATATIPPSSGAALGFGVGEWADFRFDDVGYEVNTLLVGSAALRYHYDAYGRVVGRTLNPGQAGEVSQFFVYDNDRIVQELDGNGILVAAWDYGVYIDELLAMHRDTNGDGVLDTTYYYLQDDLYNVIGLTDASGNVLERYAYEDYGAPSFYTGAGVSTGQNYSAYGNPFLFTGRRWDETLELYDYRTRYYDPYLGRFLRIDTIGLWGDPNNLGNPYAYCGNNPWSRTDPFGEGLMTGFLAGDYEASDWEFWKGVGSEVPMDFAKGVKGVVYTGPKNTVTGVASIVRHPVRTAEGIAEAAAAAYADPVGMAQALGGSLAEAASDPEAIGAFTFDTMLGVATAGAGKAAYARKAGMAGDAADLGRAADKLEDVASAGKAAKRLAQDARVNPKAPILKDTVRPISKSPSQNAFKDQLVEELEKMDARDVRVDQQQVNYTGKRVGINRPDVQWSSNGKRYYLELERPGSPRGQMHVDRIRANDPSGIAHYYEVR